MKWDYERFRDTFTVIVLREAQNRGFSERDVFIKSGVVKDMSGKSERRAKSGERHWTIRDIVLICNMLKINPSTLLDKTENFYATTTHEEVKNILQTEFRKPYKT